MSNVATDEVYDALREAVNLAKKHRIKKSGVLRAKLLRTRSPEVAASALRLWSKLSKG